MWTRRSLRPVSAAILLLAALSSLLPCQSARPNILWVYVEDMNPWMGCYGDSTVATPHVDALAARGVRFDRAYMPAAVCSATRSALITGTMQTTFGLHNHRSARAEFRGKAMGSRYDAIRLPQGVRTAPELFRAAGYYTFNQGKTDYNFVYDAKKLYDRANGNMNLRRVDLHGLWAAARKSGQPFFGQIQLRGGKNRPTSEVDPSKVEVPSYYPDIPLVRGEFAHHYDCIRQTDAELGSILGALRRDGLLESTVVFFFSDHGFRMLRHKQFLYEGGIRVPLVVAGPGIPERAGREDLVSGIDITATSLALAGIALPEYFEGRDLLADGYRTREFVIAARDRCDYTIERIRAVVTRRYKYLRNYLTDRPYMQPQYRDPWPVTKKLRAMAEAGELNEVQLAFFGRKKPSEELYDLVVDPHETKNLAHEPSHSRELRRHQRILAQWIEATGDRGRLPESEAGLRAVLARWGKKCVDPEYEPVRAKLAKLRRVLILGDSISMGYGPYVKGLLADDAIVTRPKENCQGTSHGVKRVDAWLAQDGGEWDLIWFNFGLHDLKHVDPETGRNSNDPRDPRQAEPERYEKQLAQIAAKLRRTGARLIFATTTPVPAGGVRPHRDPTDVQRYNEIAKRVMRKARVPVHDLYAFASDKLDEIQRPVNVHFTKEGSQVLAAEVARRIRAALAR